MSYNHITSFQRNELSALLRTESKQKNIAKLLNKTPSAICQELKRNPANTKMGYDAKIAKKNTKDKRIKANQRFRKVENNKWIRKYIIRSIKKYWSPEQISGRIKKKWPDDKSRHISKDSIYEFIYEERKDLVKYLRCQKDKYCKRYTITYDNESTFAYYEMIERKTGITIYFAYPYHSWERETNENTNGLLRQFFPKKSYFVKIAQDDINKATKLINNRLKKRLNYKTPAEVFHQKN